MSVVGRYAGPAYPFGSTPDLVLGPKIDLQVVLTSIFNIITTPKGSIPYNPKLGSVIPNLVFEPNDEVTMSLLRHFAEKDLGEQEPRIVVVSVFTERTGDHTITLRIGFSLVGDPTGKVYGTPVIFPIEV